MQYTNNLGNTPNDDLKKGIAGSNQQPHKTKSSNVLLDNLLELREKIKKAKSQPVIFSQPLIEFLGKPVIFPNTINLIQGQTGAHKSRLAEIFCIILLNCALLLAGFKALLNGRRVSVCYVDSERNIREQLPAALQSIQIKAGFNISEHPNGFDYISLLDTDRVERFDALKEYLDFVRETTDTHIVIVLDVLSDCCKDFNRPDDAMPLIDHLNRLINNYDVTFICIIHENPGSEKARGHLGTEISNKASTVMQVGYEKDSAGKDTDLIRVKFLKCRNTRRHEPFYLKYCETFKGLVLADESEIKQVSDLKKIKAAAVDVADKIEQYLHGEPITGKALTELLMRDFEAGERTIEERIKEIIATDTSFTDKDGKHCKLDKYREKRAIMYRLTPRD